MTLDGIEKDDVVKSNIIITHPSSHSDQHEYYTIYQYIPKLFGIHEKRMSFIDFNYLARDYTKNQDIVWEAAFEKEIKTGVLDWQVLEKIYSKAYNIKKLSKNNLHEIVTTNTIYLAKFAQIYDEMKIINELCTK